MSLRRDAYWTAVDTVVSSGLAFLLRFIVARMLAPEDFGVAMIAMAVIAVLQTFNDFGMSATLIQKDEKDITRDLIDTTFTASLIITILLALVSAFVVAPLAARLYGEPRLEPLLLVLSLTLLPSPVSTVASALMFRASRFRTNAFNKVLSNVIGMVVAVIVLVISPSPWVIILQVMATAVSAAVLLQIAQPYRYRLRLVREHLGPIFGFSSFIFLGSLLTQVQANAGIYVLGLVLTTASVGYYAFAVYLTDTARKVVMSILNRVTFVHYSRHKHDNAFLREKYVSTVTWNCRALFPLMTVMMLFGPRWAPQLLGPQWSGLGPLIFWLSLMVIIGTAGGATSNLFKSMGRPGLDFSIALCSMTGVLFPTLYFSGLYFGLEGAAIGTCVAKLIGVSARLIILSRLIPGAATGALRASFHQALLLAPIGLIWLLLHVLKLGVWYYEAPIVAVALGIYGFVEIPRAFPGAWQRVRGLLGRHQTV